MAEKKMDNPLENLETFNPGQIKREDSENGDGAAQPLSPLNLSVPDSSALPDGPIPTSMEELWQKTHQEMEQLRLELSQERSMCQGLERKNFELETAVKLNKESLATLDQERQARLGLEREISALEVQVRDVNQMREALDKERELNKVLERKLAALEVKSDRAEQWADQLAEERQVRLDLERKTATLEVEVKNSGKLEKLLDEERKARMNAQSRAATAEAKLARFEGELLSNQQVERGFFNRLRGR